MRCRWKLVLEKHQQLTFDRNVQFPQQALHNFLSAAGPFQLARRHPGLNLLPARRGVAWWNN